MQLVADAAVGAARRLGIVSDRGLLVPPALEQLARSHGVVEARELASWAEAFPDVVADALGWDSGDVVAAAHSLTKDLGLAPGGGRVAFGARAPIGVEIGRTTAGDLAGRRGKRGRGN